MARFSLIAAVVSGGIVALVGCGRETRPEEIPDIDGSWSYNESINTDRAGVTCTLLGTLSLVQDFETFVGSFIRTVSCSGGGEKAINQNESGPIARGRVRESGIEFRIGNCDYRGTLTKPRPVRMTGTTLCAGATLSSTSVSNSAGSWLAERLADTNP